MLTLPTKINDKKILALQVGVGLYLAALYFMQGFVFDSIYLRFGLAISNDSPIFTAFLMFALTAPLSILLSSLIKKNRLLYDAALQAALVAVSAYSLLFAVLLLIRGNSIFAFIGFLFFASIFGFALSAVTAVVYEKLNSLKKTLIP